jgi:acyl-CoA thioesterase I
VKPLRIPAIIFCILLVALPPGGRGQDQKVRVACVGNSITWGGLGDKSYPEQMGVILGPGYDVRNFGSSGRTMLRKGDFPYWQESIFYDAMDFDPHIVVIELGTNDSKPQNWIYGSEYARDYRDLIAAFRQQGRHPEIYLCYPPPAFSNAWGITDTIIHHQIIPKIDSTKKLAGTLFIDFYSYFTGKGAYFPDGIHPNAAGYTLMAQLVADSIAAGRAGVIRYFEAGLRSLEQSQGTSLSWKASPGSAVTLDGLPVNPADSAAVAPTESTTYRLIATGPGHADTSSLTIRYSPPGTITAAKATPSVLATGSGDTATISWATAAGTVSASWDGSPAPLKGTMTVAPGATATYVLTTSGDHPDSSRVTVRVLPADSVNRALSAPASSLSFMRHNPPALAADGDPSTFWMSSTAASQWLTIDLKKTLAVNRIAISWLNSPATLYYAEILDSAGNVAAMKSFAGTPYHRDVTTGLAGTGRFVKLLLLKKTAAEWGYTLAEVEVYGTNPGVSGVRDEGTLIQDFRLEQNYPNPFNPSTTIRFTVGSELGQVEGGQEHRVRLAVYDLLGREVGVLVDGNLPPGEHLARWNPTGMASGIYVCRLTSQGTSHSLRMVYLR